MVATRQGLPEDRINVKYQGKTLNKTNSVGYLGVCAETVLKVEVGVRVSVTAASGFLDACVTVLACPTNPLPLFLLIGYRNINRKKTKTLDG